MRFPVILSIIILLSACSQKKESAMRAEVDSLQAAMPTQDVQPNDAEVLTVESAIYIGPIMPFAETKEFYTSLYTLDDLNASDSKYIQSKLDSVIADDHEGNKRTRLPQDVAKRYFNLTGLNRISVYNKAADLVTDARFVRVEFLEGEIESEYVAVFKPMIPDWFTNDISYCVTAHSPYKHLQVAFKGIEDSKLAAKLAQQFEIDSAKIWRIEQLQFVKDKSIWSVLAVDPGSYIIETTKSGSSVIFESDAEYSVTEIMPVNMEINNKPVLLATVAINETDWIWSTLLVFKDGSYEVMKSGRIEP